MALKNLLHIKKYFDSSENAEEKQELFKETLLMTLSRATRADLTTDDSEVKTVQAVWKEVVGEDIAAEEIRVAASSELFEDVPLDKFLVKVGPQLDGTHNRAIVEALVAIFEADGKVSSSEIDFFNIVARSLALSPSDIVGLVPADA